MISGFPVLWLSSILGWLILWFGYVELSVIIMWSFWYSVAVALAGGYGDIKQLYQMDFSIFHENDKEETKVTASEIGDDQYDEQGATH